IFRDQGGGILCSLGLMPSACIGDKKSYFEPSHGSAPDIAGQNIANPYAMVGSVAMMLDMIMDLEQESKNIWKAMQSVFAEGFSTPDLSNTDVESKMIGTDAFGDKIVAHLKNI
ncbi:MAG: 3-isopropylmalate dehydrogenase, partial [Deltaproteobacteria bacterium]|nr:3-isopropylmalate dehydrogenase [Deltaproteobacteria bacterium]